MSLRLSNTSGRLITITLPHESYCKTRGECSCSVTKDRRKERIPGSLTLPSGDSVGGLDEAVLAVAEVRDAVRAGRLRAEREEGPDESEQPADEVTVPAEHPEERETQPKRKRGGA